jgi:hypothetical protein
VSFATSLGATAVAALLLFWSRFPPRWRQALALLASVAGIVFLVMALGSEGQRETPSTAVFLVGPRYVTSQAAASAGLPYYVLTGLCLMLGTLGLALAEHGAEKLKQRPMTLAVGVSLLVLSVRFLLEKTAAPYAVASFFGVTWLTPVVGAFLWSSVAAARRIKSTSLLLLAYGLVVRGTVTILYVVATVFRLGSHFDVHSLTDVSTPWGTTYHFAAGSLHQLVNLVLVPQLVVWPIYTVVSGLVGAAVAAAIAASWRHAPAA